MLQVGESGYGTSTIVFFVSFIDDVIIDSYAKCGGGRCSLLPGELFRTKKYYLDYIKIEEIDKE